MWKYLNKGISTPIAIGIIAILVALVGGFTWWSYSEVRKEETNILEVELPEKKQVITSNEFLEVTSPVPYQKISSPVKVSGKSNFFEANTRIRIKDNNGKILADTFTIAGGWMGELHLFSEDVPYDVPSSGEGVVEVFEESAKDGSEIHKIVIPVVFEDYIVEGTTDWQTYRNEEYGFEFQYPQAYKDNNCEVKNTSNRFHLGSEIYFDIISSEKSDFLDHVDNYIKDWQKNHKLASKENITINGESAIKAIFVLNGRNKDFQYTIIFLYLGENIFVFTVDNYYLSDSKCNYEDKKILLTDVFEKMLSTFKVFDISVKQIKANFVYLTDEGHNGNLGGRLGADEKCTPPPYLNCKAETIHALLTVNSDDSIINMAENYNLNTDLPIYWVNKESKRIMILSNNWFKMIEGDIISAQGEGTEKSGMSWVWTGGKGDKGNEESHGTCKQWTSDSDYHTSRGVWAGSDRYGFFDYTGDGWAGISMVGQCSALNYLRCICEGDAILNFPLTPVKDPFPQG